MINNIAFPTSGKLYPFIPYDLLIDIDFGLINYIKSVYNNNDIWEQITFSDKYNKDLIYDINNRLNRNPLSLIAKKQINEMNLNSLYNEFITKEKPNIIKNSITTSLYSACKLLLENEIKIYIACNDIYEQQSLVNFFYLKSCNNSILTTTDYSNFDFSIYDPIYIKDISILQNISLEGKNIYIANYGFNIYVKDNVIYPITLPISHLIGKNEIKIFNLYNLGGQQNE